MDSTTFARWCVKTLRSRTCLFTVVIALAGASAFVISCATVDRVVVAPPMIPGAKYVGMETCGTCHEEQVKDFKMTAHARVTIPGEDARVRAIAPAPPEEESCHREKDGEPSRPAQGCLSTSLERGNPDQPGRHGLTGGPKHRPCHVRLARRPHPPGCALQDSTPPCRAYCKVCGPG